MAVRIDVPAGSTATVEGPANISVITDVIGSVKIDGEPVVPGTVPDVAPSISSLSPNTAVAGDAADITLVVTGDGFGTNPILTFGGLDEPTTVVSDTEVSTIVKPSLFAVPDDVPVAVRNGSAVSNELTFTFTDPGAGTQQQRSHSRRAGHRGG